MDLASLASYSIAVIVLVTLVLAASQAIGERHDERATGEPYESGVAPTGEPHVRLSVQYYLVAMFFLIFDLEAVFLFTWALRVRELGWSGFILAAFFAAVLFAALAYLWRDGALDWGTLARLKNLRKSAPRNEADR